MSDSHWQLGPFRWDGSLRGDLVVTGKGGGFSEVSVEIAEAEKGAVWTCLACVTALPRTTSVQRLEIATGAWVRIRPYAHEGGAEAPFTAFM